MSGATRVSPSETPPPRGHNLRNVSHRRGLSRCSRHRRSSAFCPAVFLESAGKTQAEKCQ